MNQQQETDYRQQLGLKKILYKYENQNQQLRSQIKALNQRLQTILNKPKTPQKKQSNINPIQEFQGQLLKGQMTKLFKQINYQTQQMKINKDGIDERHEQKCMQLENQISKQQKEMKQLKHKLQKYEQIDEGMKLNDMFKNNNIQSQKNYNEKNILSVSPDNSFLLQLNNKTLRNGTIRVQNYLQKLTSIKQETQKTRRSIKDLEHQRDQNDRNLMKVHAYNTDVKQQNRILQHGKSEPQSIDESLIIKKGGIVGMENTTENYYFIKTQLQKLKRQNDSALSSVKNQNIVLENKVKQLEYELDGLNRSVQIPPLPYMKRPLKIPPVDLSISTKFQSPLLMKKSLKPFDVGPAEFQRNNDKNYVPKKMKKVQWQSTKNKSGVQWYDGQLKSPIIGVNLWFDGHLIGVQFIHTLGNSAQHLQNMSGKKVIPIQYRVSTNDHIENVIIYISQGLIFAMEFVTKNGRVDKFGNSSRARKHDFGIKKSEKPVISFGQFRINNNCSQITKLGFQVV